MLIPDLVLHPRLVLYMYHEAAELVKKDVKTILLQCAVPAAQDIDQNLVFSDTNEDRTNNYNLVLRILRALEL